MRRGLLGARKGCCVWGVFRGAADIGLRPSFGMMADGSEGVVLGGGGRGGV